MHTHSKNIFLKYAYTFARYLFFLIATSNSRGRSEPRSNQQQQHQQERRKVVDKKVTRDESFSRGISRASSPVPSNFSVDKSSKEFDDSTR